MARVLIMTCLMTVVSLPGMAATVEDLSESAREFVGKAETVVIALKDGRMVEGRLVRESDEELFIEIDRGTIRMKRSVPKSKIKAYQPADVCEDFADRLLEVFVIVDESSYALEEYETMLALFGEFERLCAESPRLAEVTPRRKALAAELERVRKGEEKIAGEWLTPVLAALKRFELLTDQIAEIEKSSEFRKEEAVQTLHEERVDKRRAVARDLPGLMRERIPTLLGDGEFDVAAEESHAFLQFWIAEVVASEDSGKRHRNMMAQVIKHMDIDYIIRMQQRVLDAYLEAGKGTGQRPAAARDDKDMVYVPGGYFLMGRREATATDDDFPMHLVYVAPYLIDRCEVSNVEYRKFVEYVKSSGDSSMEHPKAPPLKEHEAEGWEFDDLSGDKQPVVGVDWFDAYAYARWAGKRLATEAEWERAAKGTGNRVYPWGDEADEVVVNGSRGRKFLAKEMDRQNPPVAPEPEPRFGCSCVKKTDVPPPPPTTLPEVTWDVDKWLPPEAQQARDLEFLEWDEEYPSACGAMHMAGNAAEWVHDHYGKKYYAVSDLENPDGPEEGSGHVVRGGSFKSNNAKQLMTTHRVYRADKPRRRRRRRTKPKPDIGFRCARSLDVTVK